MPTHLVIRGGETARAVVRERGLDPDSFSALLGASGGPKWLMLSRMDRVLARRFVGERRQSLAVLGTSIGTFRHACFAMRDPLAALSRFEEAYIGQVYETRPTAEDVSAESRRILGILLGADGAREIVENPVVHTHVVTARSRWATRSDARGPLSIGLGAAAFVNALWRPALGAFFQRAVFSKRPSAFRFEGFDTVETELTEANIVDAIAASGSIPLVMSAVDEIAGAPPGVYRDGGIVDYHFDFTFSWPDGLLLFPHFSDRIVPGWFDKALDRRRPDPALLDRVLFIAPSDEFVASLPGGKIPDRTDFETLDTSERFERWLSVVERCRVLEEELEELMNGRDLADRIEGFS